MTIRTIVTNKAHTSLAKNMYVKYAKIPTIRPIKAPTRGNKYILFATLFISTFVDFGIGIIVRKDITPRIESNPK